MRLRERKLWALAYVLVAAAALCSAALGWLVVA